MPLRGDDAQPFHRAAKLRATPSVCRSFQTLERNGSPDPHVAETSHSVRSEGLCLVQPRGITSHRARPERLRTLTGFRIHRPPRRLRLSRDRGPGVYNLFNRRSGPIPAAIAVSIDGPTKHEL